MLEKHHVDLTTATYQICRFGDEYLRSAGEAARPDTMHHVRVTQMGYHVFGHNFASLTHFCCPIHEKDGTFTGKYQGYRIKSDKSVRALGLGTIVHPLYLEVYAEKSAWAPHITKDDPLVTLLNALRVTDKSGRQMGSTVLDDLCFPSGAVMAEWLGNCYLETGNPVVLSWCLHFVQDACVSYHRKGKLLDRHAEGESILWEKWWKMRAARRMYYPAPHPEMRPPRWCAENRGGVQHDCDDNLAALTASIATVEYLGYCGMNTMRIKMARLARLAMEARVKKAKKARTKKAKEAKRAGKI